MSDAVNWGAHEVDSSAEVANSAEVILLPLPTDEAVMAAADGALSVLDADQLDCVLADRVVPRCRNNRCIVRRGHARDLRLLAAGNDPELVPSVTICRALLIAVHVGLPATTAVQSTKTSKNRNAAVSL